MVQLAPVDLSSVDPVFSHFSHMVQPATVDLWFSHFESHVKVMNGHVGS